MRVKQPGPSDIPRPENPASMLAFDARVSGSVHKDARTELLPMLPAQEFRNSLSEAERFQFAIVR
jgi:hypothetical protein